MCLLQTLPFFIQSLNCCWPWISSCGLGGDAVATSLQVNEIKRKIFCIRDLGTNLISFETKRSSVCDSEGQLILCANVIALSFSSHFHHLQFHFKVIIIWIQKLLSFFFDIAFSLVNLFNAVWIRDRLRFTAGFYLFSLVEWSRFNSPAQPITQALNFPKYGVFWATCSTVWLFSL